VTVDFIGRTGRQGEKPSELKPGIVETRYTMEDEVKLLEASLVGE